MVDARPNPAFQFAAERQFEWRPSSGSGPHNVAGVRSRNGRRYTRELEFFGRNPLDAPLGLALQFTAIGLCPCPAVTCSAVACDRPDSDGFNCLRPALAAAEAQEKAERAASAWSLPTTDEQSLGNDLAPLRPVVAGGRSERPRRAVLPAFDRVARQAGAASSNR